jgi:hypothetical protein
MSLAPEPGGFSLADGTRVRPADPFFITGSGRCGTTLMRRMILERAAVVIPPENYILALSTRLMQQAGSDWPVFCRLALANLRRHSAGWAFYGIDPREALGLLSAIDAAHRSMANFWHGFHALYATRVNKPGETRWGDKTPSNVDALPDILQVFPAARFVFMVRDVFDVAYSYGSMSTPGRAGRYLEGAQRWIDANRRMLAFAGEQAAQSIIVRYEDVVRAPDQAMPAVLRHLNLPAMAAGAMTAQEAQDIAARPDLRNVLTEVSGGFIGKGRSGLSPEIKARIAGIAGPLQRRFGFEPTGAVGAPAAASMPA